MPGALPPAAGPRPRSRRTPHPRTHPPPLGFPPRPRPSRYKDGLIRGGVPRLLMLLLAEANASNGSVPAIEQATSCTGAVAKRGRDDSNTNTRQSF